MTENNITLQQITSLEAQINQLKQEKSELKALLEMATARDAAGNFLNLISHELRTPLTSVNSALELLKEGEVGSLNNYQVEFLGVAVQNTRRMIKLIETLFDIARFETGLLNLEKMPVNLKSVLDNILTAGFKKTFERKEIDLTLELTSAPLVEADPQRLYQILENLLSNACKFTPCGGQVAVRAVPHTGNKILISVRDSGVGLSEQSQAYLFTKVFRLEQFLTRELSSSGLGLTITNCLLALHQSSLQIESQPGQGSTFSFALAVPYTGV
jgi:signal transduction histidine kinase